MANNDPNPYSDAYRLDYQDGDVSLERNPTSVTDFNTSKIHTVLDGETLQSISFKYYGDSGYWGVLADVNSLYDIFDELIPGMEIKIPVYGRG